MKKKAYLILADGSVFEGRSFGAEPISCSALDSTQPLSCRGFGETVFNTSMTGYHEILTDPSYSGQLVMMTYPHIGNYGTLREWSENDEGRIRASGLIVHDIHEGAVPAGRTPIGEYLAENGIPGISDVDTRRLTLHLRDHGSCNGVIVCSEQERLTEAEEQDVLSWLEASPSMEGLNLAAAAGRAGITTFHETGSFHMGLIDFGIKSSIIDQLTQRDVKITCFPPDVTAEELLASGIAALFLSNGPGDPGVLTEQIKTVRSLIGTLPVFGICLGHQIIASALGSSTYKMSFGHHGGNHPVRDEYTGKVFVTSQNHGFAVRKETLPEDTGVWFTNANDGSVEGLCHSTLPVMSVQFHPEAAPGPHDASYIFDSFLAQGRSAAYKGGSCQQEQI